LQEWQPGDVVREKYRIIHKIGQGGMGAIYKAEHLIFEELRALKVLVPQLAYDEALVRSLQQEARITRRLSHPNAVRVEDVDRAEDGRLFIAMEYVEGKSIKKIIEQSGPIPVLRVIEIARQLCSALDCAHSLGMIHRDIKPDNILLVRLPDDRDLAKILDFGIAKLKESAKEHGRNVTGVTITKTGFVVGTPQYMSPEQAMGTLGDRLDGRSDLYSVGVLLYEALTGDLPFHADTPLGYILHHVNTLPRSPIDLRPDLYLPDSMVNIVMKALEKDPAARFQSAREMSLALTAVVEIFEKETVIKKVHTRRTHKPDLRAISPPPPTPRVEEESREEQVPSPASIALSRPDVAAVAGPRRSTPRDAEERMSGRQPILSSSALRFGRLLSVIGRKQVWIGTAALLVVVSALLRVWVSSSRPPTVTSRPESNTSAGSKVQEPKQPLGRNPTGAESQSETRNPSSLPPSPQRGTTPAPRGATATRQTIKPQSPTKAPQRSPGLSLDEQARLKDKLATASFYMDHGDYDNAVQTYNAALEIDPTSMQAREGLRKALQLLDILKNRKTE
jgi:serine/threonine protein kinase